MTIYEALKDTDVKATLQSLYLDPVWKNTIGAIRIGLGLAHDDDKSIITAKQVANICTRAGHPSVESLVYSIQNGNVNLLGLTERIPKVDVKKLETITVAELHRIVTTYEGFNKHEAIEQKLDDETYKLLTKEDVEEIQLYIAKKSPTYESILRDCDDFQREVRGWLSSVGLGNVTIGFVNTQGYDSKNNPIIAHAGCVVVYKENREIKVKFLEPMSGYLWDLGTGMTVNSPFFRGRVEIIRWGF